MKRSGHLSECGIPVGNYYDKYHSKNPVVRFLMKRFDRSLNSLIDLVNPSSIHEVGCGEGQLTLSFLKKGIESRGSDFSYTIIEIARSNAARENISKDHFFIRDVYHLEPESDRANLVICSQVLEHLDDPGKALSALGQISDPWLIISVPREPIWRILNLIRGKYWRNFGNTPGHIQRWNKKSFMSLVSAQFDITRTLSPLPWIILLCKNKSRTEGEKN